MPCNCDGYPEPEPDLHSGILAEMLCRIMTEHEARGEMKCFSSQQLAWWKEHKRIDAAARRADEKARAELQTRRDALAKLTPAERKALGVEK